MQKLEVHLKNPEDKKAMNAVQETKGGEWSVMNRSNPSPNKSNVPVQVVASTTVSVANSFGVLMNEYEEDSGKNWQQTSLEAEQKSGQLPGDGKQQNLPKHTTVSANVSKDIVLIDGKSVSQAGQNSSPSSGKHPVSSSSKRDQGRAKGQATDRGVFSTSQAAGTLKATGKSVQNAKAGGSSKNTGDKKAMNAVQETKGGEWSVMNRSNPSPNKSNVPVQVVASTTVSVANSFGVLMNEYEEDSGKNWQQTSLEAEQKSGQLPGDGKQQNLPKHTAVSANVSKDIVLVDGKSVSQAGQNSSPSSGKHPVSSSSKRDQGRGIGRMMICNRRKI
ncbi:hypothetical protein A4A49_29957 [Nicotiana attenuata]|uniref:Uncharacterized protein n=1 Tax=Nicotiana attenuata TaxID=49451 RepID=A0A1J6L9M4_NICAT|nr:hypothetical protein A4A49_29957 [Nicotiana attenuata]